MFTQTALRACVSVLKRFFCQMQGFDWLPLWGALRDDTKNDCEGDYNCSFLSERPVRLLILFQMEEDISPTSLNARG